MKSKRPEKKPKKKAGPKSDIPKDRKDPFFSEIEPEVPLETEADELTENLETEEEK